MIHQTDRALRDLQDRTVRALDDVLNGVDEDDHVEAERVRAALVAFRQLVLDDITRRRLYLAVPWSTSRPS